MLLALAVFLLQAPEIPDILPGQTTCNETVAARIDSAPERGARAQWPAVYAVPPSSSNFCQEEPLLPRPSLRAQISPANIAEISEAEPVLPAVLPGQTRSREADLAPSGEAGKFTPANGVGRRPPLFTAKTSPFRAGAESLRSKRVWYGLLIAQHGAATFDAWTTRRVIQQGRGRELNPLMRPFAHSGALYAAVQVAPAMLDYLGKRMMTSHKPWARRLWWVPQVAGTGASLWSGAHNLRVAR